MDNKEDFEVLEPKDYTGKRDEAYSHSLLVMNALKKVIECRSNEMRDGYSNTKFDRVGNAHQVWIPDSRMVFIETVEGLMMIQERDYDDEIIKEIKVIKDDLNIKYKEYVKLEQEFWRDLDYPTQQGYFKDRIFQIPGMLNEKLNYSKIYIRDTVNAYTKIVSLIQQSIKRLGDYQEELYEA